MGLIDSIIGAESGGNPNASNPNSSASGLGQFIDSTWLSTIRAHRPDLAGQPDADLLALKSDPQLSREMTGAYASDNQAILSKAGFPVTGGNTYLAHFAGPGGAVSVLSADPSTPVSQILPHAMGANPFLQGMTAGDLRAWAERKVGGGQGAPAASATRLGAIPAQPAPMFPQAPQQQAAAAPSPLEQIPTAQAPPIFYAPRKPINLSALRAALGGYPKG
jgi:hypothetical protein